jgi:acetate kinase
LNNDKLKVITCHIGNGWSLTAIDAWKVIETSMWFTPLPGIMMGSRSWDIDPSILEYICSKKWITINEATKELNKSSGLLGVSWISSDSRDIEDAIKEWNERAKLTQEMYVQKIANYIAMYNNMLNWADVIVMTAWVWENSISTRKMIWEKISSLWVKIDDEKNNFRGEFREISASDSKIPVYVIPTNEELMIAQDTYNIIKEN